MPLFRSSLAVAFLVGLAASGAAAQSGAPLALITNDTEVATLGFEAVEGRLTLDPAALELQVAMTAPAFFDKAPWRYIGLGKNQPHPFNPIELQKDVVRLQRYYGRNGFPRALVDYVVDLDTSRNTVGVTFQIAEGPPLVLSEVEFGKPSAPPVTESLAPELREEWLEYVETLGLDQGERLTEFSLVSLQNRTRQWLRTRGYAWADINYERFIDSTGLAATVRLKVAPGPLAVYDAIRVERVDSTAKANITDHVILRELPFRVGDMFNATDLVGGQREIFGLGVFQLATVDVVQENPPFDSTVTVVVRVRESPLRVLRAFGGYFTEGGVTGRLEATHRNAFGGARNASATVEARTGIFDQSGVVDGLYDYRAALALRQPYVLNRSLSYTLTPAVRSRNDEIERSQSASLTNTLLFTRSALQTAGLNASYQARRVDAFRSSANGFFDLSNVAGDSTLAVTTTAVGLDVTAGFVDNPLQPRSGVILRPSVRIATPFLSDYRYVRAELTATGFLPLGERTGLTGKVTAGTFSPYNGTELSDDITYVLLRDQYFYGGGGAGVRGWAVTQLGPKVINYRIQDITDSSGDLVTRDTTVLGYVGIGGSSKLSGSVQLNLPLPLGPQWGSSIFLDGGVISAVVEDFDLDRTFGASPATEGLEQILREEGGFRFATGAGIQYLTPIGFVGFALGIKLNPSYFDLRNAEEIFCGASGARGDNPAVNNAQFCDAGFKEAARRGGDFDFESVEPSKLFGLIPQAKRLQLQITFGQSF